MLSDAEREELKASARSSELREDSRKISQNRHNPFIVNGCIDLEKVVTFLTEYNYFINHAPKTFRRIIDKANKL